MLVKPASGLKVRDPRTLRFIPEEGIEADPNDLTIVRLLNDGDVIDATPKAEPASEPKKPAPPPPPPPPPPAAPAAKPAAEAEGA
jgi:hypothetical protein